MALPAIFRRLFRDNGYSPLLKPEIIPFTTDASSDATNVAASTNWVRNATNGYINGLSISGKTITYTKGNGTTGTIVTQDTTYAAATQSANGLMSAADKKKLDGINASAGNYTLFATWAGSMPNVTKTITGCVVGKPVLILYNTSRWNKTNGLNDGQMDDQNFTFIKVLSGAVPQYGWTTLGYLAWVDPVHYEELSLILIPTASTISVTFGTQMDGDDILYVYR